MKQVNEYMGQVEIPPLRNENERLTDLISDINNVVSAHLLDVFGLVLTMRERVNFRTQSFGEHHSIVTQSTNSDDAYFLSRTTAVSDKGRKDGKTSAQHRRRIFGREGCWNREYELLVSADGGGVSVEMRVMIEECKRRDQFQVPIRFGKVMLVKHSTHPPIVLTPSGYSSS